MGVAFRFHLSQNLLIIIFIENKKKREKEFRIYIYMYIFIGIYSFLVGQLLKGICTVMGIMKLSIKNDFLRGTR